MAKVMDKGHCLNDVYYIRFKYYLLKERIYEEKTNDAFGLFLPLPGECDSSDEC
jgi:hypothetical protein